MSTDEEDDAPTNALEEGDILAGRFELLAKLGSGANGVVWKALNLRLGVKVAIKIPTAANMNADRIERFRREARALCVIDSEHVLRFFEYNDVPRPFLVMELLKGEDLAIRLKREGALPLDQVKELCRQLCRGLQAAHDAGVIHRDLKPANIYCLDDRFKIVDFGLMKLVKPAKEPATEQIELENEELTRKNIIMGTRPYMSPEQYKLTEHEISFRSDLWSLSVLLYKALMGRLPFVANHERELTRLILFEDAPRPSSLIPGLPEDVDRFFETALAKDPDRRFSSAVELSAAFEAIGASSPAAAPDPPSPPSIPGSSEMSTAKETATSPGSAASSGPGDDETSVTHEATTPPKRRASVPDRPSSVSLGTRPWSGAAIAVAAMIVIAVIVVRSDFFLARCGADNRDCDGRLLNGCETDVRSMENCGACGRRCVNEHGATSCVAGACSPTCAPSFADCDGDPTNGCETNALEDVERGGVCEKRYTAVAPHMGGPGATLVLDDEPDGSVYVADPGRQTISMVKKGGGPITSVSTIGAPTSLVARGHIVYWIDGDSKRLVRLSNDGSPPKAVVEADKRHTVGGLAMYDERHAYFALRDAATAKTDIWRLEPQAVVRVSPEDKFDPLLGFVAGRDRIYWMTAEDGGTGALWRLDVAPGSRPKQIINGRKRPRSLSLDRGGEGDPRIYWIEQATSEGVGAVVSMAEDGSSPRVLVGEQAAPRHFALDDKAVYFSSSDGTIRKLPRDGGGSPIVLASGQSPDAVAADREYVYWLNTKGGELMRTGKLFPPARTEVKP